MKKNKSMNIIVFGSSGFLGSFVVGALMDAGHSVRLFDQTENQLHKGVQNSIIGSITDFDTVCQAVKGCDVVYNFAGIAGIAEANENPIKTCEVNVLGVVNTLQAATLAKVKRYIFASSVYVFGESGAFYRASKQSAERFIEVYKEHYDLPFTILRYGSLYGRRADMNNGIHRILSQAILEGKVTHSGNGEELREYIHVEDAARLSVEILKEQYANQHFVLTGQEKMRMSDVVHMIQELLQKEITVEYNAEQGDPHYSITPYAFNPRLGKKLVSQIYTDIGQGLLDCIQEIHEKDHHKNSDDNIMEIKDS